MPAVPRVLVLLATYNGARWLRAQLDSILAQQGVCVSIIVGDDCSKDETRSVIDEYIEIHSAEKISLLGWSKSSGSAGANFRRLYVAADLAEVDFVALADQDDVWYPKKISHAIELLYQENAQAYSSAVAAFWPDGRKSVLEQSPCERSADFIFEGAGQGCTFLMTGSFFERVQSFCVDHPVEIERLHYHDWLVYLLARTWGMSWVFDSTPSMRYRQHGGNEIGARGGWAAVDRRLQMIRNGWYRGQICAASNLYRLAGGGEADALRLSGFWMGDTSNQSGSVLMRLLTAVRLLRYGRRRALDRWVLALAVLVGWI
jgi:rhamnosyltransferase